MNSTLIIETYPKVQFFLDTRYPFDFDSTEYEKALKFRTTCMDTDFSSLWNDIPIDICISLINSSHRTKHNTYIIDQN